jgi:hypothetical protein
MDVSEKQADLSFLRRSAAAYEAVVAHVIRLDARGDDEETLKWLRLAASVAWFTHPGRFADERLEAIALRAGQRLEPLRPTGAAQTGNAALAANGRRCVLHVATSVHETGGHTRLIENWIRHDDAALHSLVLLDQQPCHIRAELVARIAASGGELVVVPANCPLLDKARRLRKVAQAGYDLVVLHHHPDDVVPLVALAVAECPPVAVMNHADHVFWLGASVADAVIDFRDYGARLSRERRGSRRSLMFPLPLDSRSPTLGRAEARLRLGIPDTEVMLLSIGSANKYAPTKKYNFFRTLHRVITDNPTARLYVVGVGEDDFRSFGVRRPERTNLLGIISDPSAHEAAADLYLESFPYGSYTALIETAARGVCPVLMYAPTSHTDISGDVPLKGLITNATDEADYVARVTTLINDPAERTRLGQAVARQIASIHGCDVGRAYLQPVYERLIGTTHRPAPLPAQKSAETVDDLSLAGVSGSRIKTAVLQRFSNHALAGLTVRDVLRLLAISLRAGDTRLTAWHVRVWLSLLRNRAFPPRAASATGEQDPS